MSVSREVWGHGQRAPEPARGGPRAGWVSLVSWGLLRSRPPLKADWGRLRRDRLEQLGEFDLRTFGMVGRNPKGFTSVAMTSAGYDLSSTALGAACERSAGTADEKTAA